MTKRSFIKQKQSLTKAMIVPYCKKHHHSSGILCPQCTQLYQYACTRIEKCPFNQQNLFCSNCKIHCYNAQMQKEMKEVMRFSGPRMIFLNPFAAFQHLYQTICFRLKGVFHEH